LSEVFGGDNRVVEQATDLIRGIERNFARQSDLDDQRGLFAREAARSDPLELWLEKPAGNLTHDVDCER
jgi:hypothetical protein